MNTLFKYLKPNFSLASYANLDPSLWETYMILLLSPSYYLIPLLFLLFCLSFFLGWKEHIPQVNLELQQLPSFSSSNSIQKTNAGK